jgi:hypothetical protein
MLTVRHGEYVEVLPLRHVLCPQFLARAVFVVVELVHAVSQIPEVPVVADSLFLAQVLVDFEFNVRLVCGQ